MQIFPQILFENKIVSVTLLELEKGVHIVVGGVDFKPLRKESVLLFLSLIFP